MSRLNFFLKKTLFPVRSLKKSRSNKPYVKSLTINDMKIETPIIKHAQLVGWESDVSEIKVVFEMSDKIEQWGNENEVLEALGVAIPLAVVDNREAVLNSPLHEEL